MAVVVPGDKSTADHRPTAHSQIFVRANVPFDAPWNWLGAGWRDLWTVPGLSLTYGAAFALAALALAFGLLSLGWQSLVLVLAGGFLLVGPMMAVGLYEVSRRLETGEAVDVRDAMFVGVKSPGQLAIMGVVLMIAYLAWVELALVLLVLFLGGGGLPPVEAFVQTLLFTPSGLGLLVTGTALGGILALLVFSMTAVSVPLLMTRDIDVVTAVATSLRAVASNPKPMLLWAALIVAMIGVGIATIFVGFVIAFPLIGHATWHAFRDIIQIEDEAEIVPDVLKR